MPGRGPEKGSADAPARSRVSRARIVSFHRRTSRLAIAIVVLALSALSGCYGQTDYASLVGQSSATLNGRGTADDGAAAVYFEYWRTADPASKSTTPPKNVPDGAAGPFSQRVTGLAAGTPYSYRLCGTDPGEGPVCAQTRTFHTGRSSVQADGDTNPPAGQIRTDQIHVDALGAPTGGSASGRVFSRLITPSGDVYRFGSTTDDNVTCVFVQGNTAMVGYRQVPPFNSPLGRSPKTQMYAVMVDGGPAGSGRDRFSAGAPELVERGPDECGPVSNPSSIESLRRGDVAINDASATP